MSLWWQRPLYYLQFLHEYAQNIQKDYGKKKVTFLEIKRVEEKIEQSNEVSGMHIKTLQSITLLKKWFYFSFPYI